MRQRGKPFLSVEHLVQEIVQISSIEKLLIGYVIKKNPQINQVCLIWHCVYTCLHKSCQSFI